MDRDDPDGGKVQVGDGFGFGEGRVAVDLDEEHRTITLSILLIDDGIEAESSVYMDDPSYAFRIASRLVHEAARLQDLIDIQSGRGGDQ